MAWFYLTLAGVLEVVWAYFLKDSGGFKKLFPTTMFFVTLALSMFFLSLSTKSLPLSIAYPVWTGIGALGSILVGTILFKEEFSFSTWIFVGLLFIGLVGIKLTSGNSAH